MASRQFPDMFPQLEDSDRENHGQVKVAISTLPRPSIEEIAGDDQLCNLCSQSFNQWSHCPVQLNFGCKHIFGLHCLRAYMARQRNSCQRYCPVRGCEAMICSGFNMGEIAPAPGPYRLVHPPENPYPDWFAIGKVSEAKVPQWVEDKINTAFEFVFTLPLDPWDDKFRYTPTPDTNTRYLGVAALFDEPFPQSLLDALRTDACTILERLVEGRTPSNWMTVKLRAALSQGLATTIDRFMPESHAFNVNSARWEFDGEMDRAAVDRMIMSYINGILRGIAGEDLSG